MTLLKAFEKSLKMSNETFIAVSKLTNSELSPICRHLLTSNWNLFDRQRAQQA